MPITNYDPDCFYRPYLINERRKRKQRRYELGVSETLHAHLIINHDRIYWKKSDDDEIPLNDISRNQASVLVYKIILFRSQRHNVDLYC